MIVINWIFKGSFPIFLFTPKFWIKHLLGTNHLMTKKGIKHGFLTSWAFGPTPNTSKKLQCIVAGGQFKVDKGKFFPEKSREYQNIIQYLRNHSSIKGWLIKKNWYICHYWKREPLCTLINVQPALTEASRTLHMLTFNLNLGYQEPPWAKWAPCT